MLFKNIAVVLVSTLGVTDAFLLPPQISKTDIDTVNALPFEIAVQGVSKVVDLKCTGCPVPAVNLDGTSVSLQHVDSTLSLNYTIEHHTKDADRLLLNGVSIYPPNLASIEPFTATQKFTKDQPFQTQEKVPVGYEMTLRPIKKDQADLELMQINIHIFEVADKFIDGIDAVELQLLKTPSGALMIASCEKKPSTSASPVGLITDDKDCTSIICKWRAIVAAKLAHLKPLKGCGKGKGKGHKTGAVSAHHGQPKQHGGRPHHGQGKHHGGHRHHRHHGFTRFMHILRNISIHVLIPIFIGVAAGLTASVIGMVIGHLVVLVWRSIRGGRPAYSRIADEEIPDEEHKILIVEPQGPPPVYEDVIVVEEVIDEKKESEA